jgi:hypothetical protein
MLLPESIDLFRGFINNTRKDFIMAINLSRLELRFQETTGCTAKKAQRHAHRYLWQCARAMIIDHFSEHAGSRYFIDQTRIQNTLGDIIVDGRRHYVWRTFQSFPERVFDIIHTGNNLVKEYTMAQSNYTMEDIILAAGTPEELVAEVYQSYQTQIQREDYDLVPIDMRSLEAYIKSNLAQDRDNPRMSAALSEELDRNLKQAQKLWMLATASGNQLMQIRTDSTFGRRYYQGPNLQTTPKIVRHAALGDCHEYDIESSVFAWKLSWFETICEAKDVRISMPATLEYLDHKKAIRKRLAQVVFDTTNDWAVNTIKELITAIGFGAPLRAQGYVADSKYQKPALAQIITAKTRLDRALDDKWLQEFVQEQRSMNQAIVALAQVHMIKELREVSELWDKGQRKLRANSVVSYLYQHSEREMLDYIEQFCADREVLLTVHDCIYTRHAVKLAELRSAVQGFGKYFRINHEQHRAYTWQDPVDENDPFYDPRELAIERRNARYDRAEIEGHYTGAGHDGTVPYDPDLDPFFDENDEEENISAKYT